MVWNIQAVEFNRYGDSLTGWTSEEWKVNSRQGSVIFSSP
jgi:hypothetical protein